MLSLFGILNAQTINPGYIDGHLYFKFNDDYDFRIKVNENTSIDFDQMPAEFTEMFERYGVTLITRPLYAFNDPKLERIIRLEFTDAQNIRLFIKELEMLEDVEYAEMVPYCTRKVTYNDPYYTSSTLYGIQYNFKWHLEMINAPQAWGIQQGSANIKVAIVDNAVWGNHPDLQIASSNQCSFANGTESVGNSAPPSSVSQSTECSQADLYTNDNCPAYDWSHGTHCAGLVGAINNNGVGISSIGGGVTLMGVRAANNNDEMYYCMNGVRWAVQQGAKVVSMSYGSTQQSTSERTAFQTFYNNGVILVAAAGNEGDSDNSINYPGGYSTVISVASVNNDGKLSSFSQHDTGRADVAAPGGYVMYQGDEYMPNILSTTYCKSQMLRLFGLSLVNGEYYDGMQGTSMATPITAGLCGLLASAYPNITPAQAKQCLISTGTALASGSNTIDNNVYINAYAAVQCAQSYAGSNTLSVSPASLNYAVAGGSQTVTVTSNTSWTATSSASWLTISPASGSNNGTITAVAAENTATSQRTATITVSGTDAPTQTISVTQAGTSSGGTFTYDFEACTAWTVDQFSPCTTYDGDGSATYTIQGSTFENQGYTGAYIAFENGIASSFAAHGGTKFGCCMAATTPPNNDWFITPAISISNGTTFSFWARSANNSYGLEQFKVAISTNNTTFSTYIAGSSSSSVSAPVEWTQYTYDLSQYAGQTMYIAIMCVSNDVFAFFIDDIEVSTSSTPSYNLTVSPSSLSYTAAGESKTVTVTSNTSWTATSSASWLTVSPASGTNNGTITAVAAANTSTSQRTATITVSGTGVTAQTISVTQAGAAENNYLTVSPSSLSYTATGENKTVSVYSNTSWTATSSASWLTISPASGSNNGTFTAIAAANTSSSQRTATITVSGTGVSAQTISVTQAGATENSYLTVSPSSLSYTATGENKTVSVYSNTSWNVVSSASWLTVSPASGSNNGTFTAIAAANTTSSQRTATITVSGNGATQTISVTQEGASSTPTYTITASSNNNAYGTVSGGGTYQEGETVTLTATANNGYVFTSWNNGSTANPLIFTATANATYIATFVNENSVTMYTITVESSNNQMGTVTGGGRFAAGTTITIEAHPNEHFRFVRWQEDNNTDNPREITVNSDATYTASFEAIPQYTIRATAGLGGTINPNGEETVYEGDDKDFIITANEGYRIKSVMVDGNESLGQLVNNVYTYNINLTEATYTFTNINAGHTISASFEAIPQYTITTMAEANNGTVTGGGTYYEGQVIQILATANEGYVFTKWNDEDRHNPRNITVVADASYTAIFAEINTVNMYTITVLSKNNEYGTATGSGTYAEGTIITIEAIANNGYQFSGWEEDGNSENPREITVTRNETFTATFSVYIGIEEHDAVEISIYPNPTSNILNISSSENISRIEIISITGKLVAQQDVNSDYTTCDVSDLSNGMYFVRIYGSEQNNVYVRKLIKE